MRHTILIAAGTLLAALPALAHETGTRHHHPHVKQGAVQRAHHDGELSYQKGDVVVSHVWTEAINAASHGAPVYLTINNRGATPDRLLGITTPVAGASVLQASVFDQASGTLTVQEIEALQVEPGQTLTLQPGGVMIEMISVQQPLIAGTHFDMTLEFERAGTLMIEVEIESPAGDELEEDDATPRA